MPEDERGRVEFRPTVLFNALKPGEVSSVEVDGHFLALYLVDGRPYCTEDICTHEGSAISAGGFVEGDEVECASHGARFNVRTGAATALPAFEALRTFPVEVRDDRVFIGIAVSG